MRNEEMFHCRVCGLEYDDPPWGYDEKSPDFTFCECCGVEFGYQDSIPKGARKFREEWLAAGAKWNEQKYKPDGWNLEEQLKHIPEEFR